MIIKSFPYQDETGTGFDLGANLGNIANDIFKSAGNLISGGVDLLLNDWKQDSQIQLFNTQKNAQIELLNAQKELETLRQQGIITQQEYETKKMELLIKQKQIENLNKIKMIITIGGVALIGIGIFLYLKRKK